MLVCEIIFAFNVSQSVRSKHVASQDKWQKWQKTDLDLRKLLKKKKSVWPALFRSLPNIKTNGRLEFLENSRVRLPKEATLEPGGLFKNFDLHKVQSFDVPFLEMDVLCLNYWLAKFIQEVAKPSKERYPPRTMHILDCVRNTSIMEEKNANLDFILLDPSEKRCSVAFIVMIFSYIVIVQLDSRLRLI